MARDIYLGFELVTRSGKELHKTERTISGKLTGERYVKLEEMERQSAKPRLGVNEARRSHW